MEDKLLKQAYRKKIINEIKSDENVQRKIVSYKKQNMQSDNFYQYVKEYIESKLDPETVQELHIFANINLQKRISKTESSIYKKKPERSFYVGDTEVDGMAEAYDLIDMDTCLKRANEAYKYQEQCAIQIFPEDRKLRARVLLPHHYDVIPHDDNPEKPMAYIISNFDNTDNDKIRREDARTGFSQGDKYRDGVNQSIADYDDQKLANERYYVTSESYNFIMNGKAEILSKEDKETPVLGDVDEITSDVESPLVDFKCIPFIDVSKEKDFEFWVRSGDVLYDATIMYNVIMTSEFQTVEMQGHAQPYYKGDAEHMPENIRIGVDKMIFIPVNPQNEVSSEFGFANPGSDLGGIREFRESFLSSFLSSRGLDTSIVSGKSSVSSASSGIEKMLQMIEKFEASQEDFSLFKSVEDKAAKIIACYVSSFRSEREDGDLMLSDEFQFQISEPDQLTVNVEYSKPEMIKTQMEELEVGDKEIEIGISSKVHLLMEYKGMTKEQAIDRIKEVDELEGLTAPEPKEENNDFET